MKYGSLSNAVGTLDVSSEITPEEITLRWVEHAGPAVTTPAPGKGFGSTLVARSVSQQLGGSIAHEWNDEGLIVTLRMNRVKLAR